MTEAEWLACEKPAEMYRWLQPGHCTAPYVLSSRKAKLWVEAMRNLIATTETVWGLKLDSATTRAHLLREIVGNPFRPLWRTGGGGLMLGDVPKGYGYGTHHRIGEISDWLTSTARELAQATYDDQDFDRLPILADALEEAGCDNREIMGHLRGLQPHVRGCWALDLLLGLK
jgi:hypothetical protein